MTHAISAAVLARATTPRQRANTLSMRERTVVGFLAGAAPDLDFLVNLAGPVAYLEQHRGPTHSLLLTPLWALVLALGFSLIRKRRFHWSAYFGVCLLALCIHIVGDLITSYGTQILAPLSNWSPGWNTTFIIDPYLSGILLVGFLLSLYWRPRTSAALTLAAATALVGYQATQNRAAMDIARAYADDAGLAVERIAVYPQPFSPWNWKLAISEAEAHHLARISLRRSSPWPDPGEDAAWWRQILASYQPVQAPVWTRHSQFGSGREDALAREVWSHEAFDFYRWFADLPALRTVDDHPERGTCVWFGDLRFQLEGLTPPFVFGMCRRLVDEDWTLYRMRGGNPVEI
nr:metal-dependent hydrolase [Natronocella acetinitrilica]